MIPLNMQPIEKPVNDPDGNLDVVHVWYTLQGEGPFAGTPAVFIRTAGCDLACPACDSDYTTGRHLLSVPEIVAKVQSLMPNPGLVVLTGGEPLRQNIFPLMDRLAKDLGYKIQIETNGTLFPFVPDNTEYVPQSDPRTPHYTFTLVCSPKTGSINERLKPFIDHLKYIVAYDKIDPEDGLPTDSLGAGVRVARPWKGFKGQVWIQPLDEQDEERNKLHLKAAADACLKHTDYRLTIQIHKLVGLE
jgi:7-carboxy-7-deazaguanine synthase